MSNNMCLKQADWAKSSRNPRVVGNGKQNNNECVVITKQLGGIPRERENMLFFIQWKELKVELQLLDWKHNAVRHGAEDFTNISDVNCLASRHDCSRLMVEDIDIWLSCNLGVVVSGLWMRNCWDVCSMVSSVLKRFHELLKFSKKIIFVFHDTVPLVCPLQFSSTPLPQFSPILLQ